MATHVKRHQRTIKTKNGSRVRQVFVKAHKKTPAKKPPKRK